MLAFRVFGSPQTIHDHRRLVWTAYATSDIPLPVPGFTSSYHDVVETEAWHSESRRTYSGEPFSMSMPQPVR